MAMGKHKRETQEMLVATCALPQSPGHPFYRKLNELLREAGFDEHVEKLCAAHYADGRGRPGIPPGVYFRMLFVGHLSPRRLAAARRGWTRSAASPGAAATASPCGSFWDWHSPSAARSTPV